MTDHRSIAVITGGTAGVGRATVDMLAARGHRVAVLARGQSRLDELSARYGDRV
jgi:NADP-dependent 3-hydroxy acid dehydrogenase YdfG